MESKEVATLELPVAADDLHVHVRDGPFLSSLVPAVARQFRRALIMPNLQPPVTTTEDASAYRQRILDALQASDAKCFPFTPLMSLYLTDSTPPEEIQKAKACGHVYAVKLYPAGATTNSANGVTDITRTYPTLREMARLRMPLLVHGEVTDSSVDIFDREKEFLTRVLQPLIKAIPELRIVLEHITTREAAEFVAAAPSNVAATITAHHLLLNRNDIFKGGVCPHHFCLPVLKREEHRQALLKAAASGSPKFFAGTDSAPHARSTKETSCGCAGCYTSHAAIELYAEAFHSVGALDKLPAFLSEHGAEFYGIDRNDAGEPQSGVLVREAWQVPAEYPLVVGTASTSAATAGDEALAKATVVPLRAGQSIAWTFKTKLQPTQTTVIGGAS